MIAMLRIIELEVFGRMESGYEDAVSYELASYIGSFFPLHQVPKVGDVKSAFGEIISRYKPFRVKRLVAEAYADRRLFLVYDYEQFGSQLIIVDLDSGKIRTLESTADYSSNQPSPIDILAAYILLFIPEDEFIRSLTKIFPNTDKSHIYTTLRGLRKTCMKNLGDYLEVALYALVASPDKQMLDWLLRKIYDQSDASEGLKYDRFIRIMARHLPREKVVEVLEKNASVVKTEDGRRCYLLIDTHDTRWSVWYTFYPVCIDDKGISILDYLTVSIASSPLTEKIASIIKKMLTEIPIKTLEKIAKLPIVIDMSKEEIEAVESLLRLLPELAEKGHAVVKHGDTVIVLARLGTAKYSAIALDTETGDVATLSLLDLLSLEKISEIFNYGVDPETLREFATSEAINAVPQELQEKILEKAFEMLYS